MTNAGALVGKLDVHGNAVWSKALGAASSVSSVSFVAADAAGNVYVTGTFNGSVNCGGGAIASVGQGEDIFVAKLDPNGNQIWVKSFGTGTNQLLVGSMALDRGNGIVLAGTYKTSVTFGGAALTPTPGATNGAFVVELAAADGSQVWSKGLPETTSLYAAVDSGGNVVLAGAFSGSVNVGGGALTSAGGDDILVARLDSSGNHLWSKKFGGADDDEVSGVAVDGNGAVLLVGQSFGGVDFGGGTVANGGSYAAKLSPSGSFVFSDDLGTAHLQSVAAAPSGNVLVAGSGTGTIHVGTAQIPPSSGGFDLLAIELDPSGHLLSNRRAGNGAGVTVNQIAANASGEVGLVAASRTGTVNLGTGGLTCSAACFLVARLSM
jgi:hypothetical protein